MNIPTGWTKRFADKVDIADDDSCWGWKGTLIPGGYGQFWLDGKMRNAHRVAVEMAGHPIPKGHVVMHSCDNRKCCNPKHLSIAKQSENIHDMMQKRRAPIGEKHGCSILSEEQVKQILKGQETALQAAHKYGVSRAAIYDIREGRSWTHLHH